MSGGSYQSPETLVCVLRGPFHSVCDPLSTICPHGAHCLCYKGRGGAGMLWFLSQRGAMEFSPPFSRRHGDRHFPQGRACRTRWISVWMDFLYRELRQESLEFCAKFYPSTLPLTLHPSLLLPPCLSFPNPPGGSKELLPHPATSQIWCWILPTSTSSAPVLSRPVWKSAAQSVGMCLVWQ